MGMGYFVTPANLIAWNINSETFVNALHAHYRNCIVTYNASDQVFSFDWITRDGDAVVFWGQLYRQEPALYLRGDLDYCAACVLWFRKLVPNQLPLVFFDEGYSFSIPISVNTTLNMILESVSF